MDHLDGECICTGKKCTKCKELLCIKHYTKDKRLRSGLKSQCRNCAHAEYTGWRTNNHEYDLARHKTYYIEHHEEILEKDRQYKATHVDQLKESRKKYYQENQEELRTGSLQYYYENKDAHRKRRQRPDVKAKEYAAWKRYYYENKAYHARRVRNWQKENPLAHAASNARRRTHKIKAGGYYTKTQWIELCNLYGNCCLDCGRTDVQLHADHIMPVSKGGSSDISNIQPLCKSCNSRKKDKFIDFRP